MSENRYKSIQIPQKWPQIDQQKQLPKAQKWPQNRYTNTYGLIKQTGTRIIPGATLSSSLLLNLSLEILQTNSNYHTNEDIEQGHIHQQLKSQEIQTSEVSSIPSVDNTHVQKRRNRVVNDYAVHEN